MNIVPGEVLFQDTVKTPQGVAKVEYQHSLNEFLCDFVSIHIDIYSAYGKAEKILETKVCSAIKLGDESKITIEIPEEILQWISNVIDRIRNEDYKILVEKVE